MYISHNNRDIEYIKETGNNSGGGQNTVARVSLEY